MSIENWALNITFYAEWFQTCPHKKSGLNLNHFIIQHLHRDGGVPCLARRSLGEGGFDILEGIPNRQIINNILSAPGLLVKAYLIHDPRILLPGLAQWEGYIESDHKNGDI